MIQCKVNVYSCQIKSKRRFLAHNITIKIISVVKLVLSLGSEVCSLLGYGRDTEEVAAY